MRPKLLVVVALTLWAAFPAHATTARDLSSRMRIDGFTSEFADDEKVFGFNPAASAAEEASDDSRWGVNNDISQIRISWDARYLYLAGEAKIWDNNLILLIDSVPGRGLTTMTTLNSWKRNFDFDTTGTAQGEGFAPDLFAATWDGNAAPRLIVQQAGNQVDDEQVGPFFNAAATFLQGNSDRAMEVRIPWRSVFLGQVGLGTRDTFMTVAGVADTFRLFPRGTKLKLCAAVTAGSDGTGGPDSAPDNLRGHTDNSSDLVFIDNYAIIDLDRNDDTGLGRGGPDGVADWGVSPESRVSFRFRPPVTALRFAMRNVQVDRPAFSPERNERVRFSVELDKQLDPTDLVNQVRRFNLTAGVYDLRGRQVRSLYTGQTRFALNPTDAQADSWDGRDDRGRIVPPGIYVIRTVIEPNLSRSLRSVVVVR